MRWRMYALLTLVPSVAAAQNDMREVMSRLARLEEQNRALVEEVRALREEIRRHGPAPPESAQSPGRPDTPPVAERLAVAEHRIEEHAQSKLETDHRLPVQLTGMLLFNAYVNAGSNNDQFNPTSAVPGTGQFTGGGTFRQSVLGLKFQGPRIFGGGKVTGSMYMDFFAGTGSSLNQLFRLRLATVDLTWKNTTFSVGQDKPLIAPREPDSLAQVGVSPLTNAGNLWLWQPQARIEQRFTVTDNTMLRAQFGVFQTSESFPSVPSEYRDNLATARPAAEGRFELAHQFSGGRALEIAGGFHASQTHLYHQSVPSRIWSLDWLIRPHPRLDFSGAFFTGENVGVTGALRQGVFIRNEQAFAVGSQGGWGQVAVRAASRLTFNLYAGQQDDQNSRLPVGGIAKNLVYAGNLMYRLGPNVLAGFEASQTRTTYLGGITRLNPHYDLALAYLF